MPLEAAQMMTPYPDPGPDTKIASERFWEVSAKP